MKVVTPTVADMDELLAFVPRLRAIHGEYLTDWGGGTKQPDGAYLMPWPIYPDVVEEFFRTAGKECWSDHSYTPTGAGAMIRDKALVESASLEQIRTMLTWCVRGERFCDGHWAKVLEDGEVYSLLERLRQLRAG